MSSSDLAVVDAVEVVLSNRDLDLIRRQVNVPRGGRPPTDVELEDFARYCVAQRLNPFDRQIYLANIAGRWQPFTGVHGRLVLALRTGAVEGMEGPYFCHKREGREREHGPDWDELWDDDTPPHAAKFVVYRRGWTRHPVGIAPWRYYNRGSGTWVSNPPLMLGYKAITRALNLVFPDVMPPSPDRPDAEPDIDETVGYIRAEVETAPSAAGTPPPRPPARQGRGIHDTVAPPDGAPGMSPAMTAAMTAMFTEARIIEPDDRKAFCAGIAGRPIVSAAEMTVDEGRAVLDALAAVNAGTHMLVTDDELHPVGVEPLGTPS
jgi:hypothetical protein